MGWPRFSLNQPVSAWGHQNLPGEQDKPDKLEGKAHDSADRLLTITLQALAHLGFRIRCLGSTAESGASRWAPARSADPGAAALADSSLCRSRLCWGTKVLCRTVTLLLRFVPCKPLVTRPGWKIVFQERLVHPQSLSSADSSLYVRPEPTVRAAPGAPQFPAPATVPFRSTETPSCSSGSWVALTSLPTKGHVGSCLRVQLCVCKNKH